MKDDEDGDDEGELEGRERRSSAFVLHPEESVVEEEQSRESGDSDQSKATPNDKTTSNEIHPDPGQGERCPGSQQVHPMPC